MSACRFRGSQSEVDHAPVNVTGMLADGETLSCAATTNERFCTPLHHYTGPSV